MPLAAIGPLLAAAAAERSAIAAFDVVTLEHVQAVVEGAEAVGAPVIVQISEAVVDHHGGRLPPLARAAADTARAAAVPVALHLDRVRRTALLAQAVHCGFGSITYDAARLPYPEQVAITRDVVAWAHEQGLYVEAELGCDSPTEPEAARLFAAATGVDSLAVALPATHGRGSYEVGGHGRSAVPRHLDHQLLAELRAVLATPLVLRDSAGLSEEELRTAAHRGIAKIAAGSALDLAMTEAVRTRFLADEVAGPSDWLADGRRAMAAAVARFIGVLGTKDGTPVPAVRA
ncbi:class II fructose-bisphosphate aldolase [Streptomyces sp. NPDC047082]|uniref:class II fructose-bisphosphate aldolase n=1 Tax=Streptomyces sp. NPDC047082 TaxID=3155259 RepID=UPI0033C12250